MCNKRGLLLAGLILAFLAVDSGARAEVSAVVDDNGYRRTIILANASRKNLKIWSVIREKTGLFPLNPDGDANGDLWPIIAEDPLHGDRPWVVWSRFTGDGYDLAWSRWADEWTTIDWVDPVPSAGDDLDPDIAVDVNDGARHYLAWWRDEVEGGAVYLSIFLDTRWMRPYRVSDVGADSRHPTVDVLGDGTIEVSYSTPSGEETRQIMFNRPDTIHDDLDPIGTFKGGAGEDGGLDGGAF